MKRRIWKRLCTVFMSAVLLVSYVPFPVGAEGTEPDTSGQSVSIDEAAFPDKVFRDYVLENFDTNKDSALSDSEIAAVEVISVASMGITELTGVEYFTGLKILSCEKNALTSLNVSENKALERLYCGNNRLTGLDVSGNTELYNLSCDSNQIDSLDLSHNSNLSTLSCQNNRLETLDTSHNEWLGSINCMMNKITSLDVSHNPELQWLYCSGNQLTSLDVGSNAKLDKDRVVCLDNRYFIGTGIRSFDLSRLPGKFDINRASGWIGADCADGKLTNFSGDGKITYTYDMGGGKTGVFTLTYTDHAHSFQNHVCEACKAVEICTATFPDEIFRKYILQECDTVKDNALMEDEIAEAEDISVSSLNLTDLTGIEYFTALKNLNCDENQLTNLNVSKNTALTSLNCYNNQLTNLDVSKNAALTILQCSKNQLAALDVSENVQLSRLYCIDNQLQSLELSKNEALFFLDCSGNLLTDLDVSRNKNLWSLYCNRNKLTEIDTGNNLELRTFQCAGNKLNGLYLAGNGKLEFLDCSGLGLTELDVSRNSYLRGLNCEDNRLTVLDLSANAILQELNCSKNELTSLDISSKKDLKTFECEANEYYIGCMAESFDLSRLPGSFDADKASAWSGAAYAQGKLTDFSGEKKITYAYDTGSEQSATFTLVYGEHKYVKNTDEKYFKAPAGCTEGAAYYYSCEFCGAAGTETFEAGEPKGHTWDEGRITKLPTIRENGAKTYTCRVCQAAKEEPVAAAAAVTEIEIETGGKIFQAKLYDNEAANALAAKLPLTLNMKDFAGKGKQYEFTDAFLAVPSEMRQIRAGDILLSGSNTLTVFYEDVSSSESYTPLGYLEDITGFAEALGSGEATVTVRLIGQLPAPGPDETLYWGDVDGKGGVTPDDALLILMDIAGKRPITDEKGRARADCDGKPGMTPDDALYILETVAGKRELKLYDGPAMNLKK